MAGKNIQLDQELGRMKQIKIWSWFDFISPLEVKEKGSNQHGVFMALVISISNLWGQS